MTKTKEISVAALVASISDQIGASAAAAQLIGDHVAHAALDDLHQILHQLKARAITAAPCLTAPDAAIVKKLLEL